MTGQISTVLALRTAYSVAFLAMYLERITAECPVKGVSKVYIGQVSMHFLISCDDVLLPFHRHSTLYRNVKARNKRYVQSPNTSE